MRIGFGLILLVDLAWRATDLRAMYAGDGVLPIEYSRALAGAAGWSLHWLSGAVWYQALLLALEMALAVGMVAGWHTRWMVFGSWLLLTSLHARNPLILNSGDSMLRVLLFWAIFLPLGAAWSVDERARCRGQAASWEPVANVASFCFVIQLCIIYWMSGLFKWNYAWLGFNPSDLATNGSRLGAANFGGDALQRALNYDLYRKPLAGVLLSMPGLLRVFSIGTVALELFAPLLLFVPIATRWWRLLVILAFALFHLGIELTLHVGLFSAVAIVAWFALLPGMFWESRPLSWINDIVGLLEVGRTAHEDSREGSSASSRHKRVGIASVTSRIAIPALCVMLLIVVIAWNACQLLDKARRPALQRPLYPLANALLLRQQWTMFGWPVERETWFAYRANLADGRVVDAFRDGQPVSMAKPRDANSMFRNHRWRKLHATLGLANFKALRQPVADFVFRRWNELHPHERILRLDLYQIREELPAQFSLLDFNEEWCLTIEGSESQAAGDQQLKQHSK
jgi:hypothetical protein